MKSSLVKQIYQLNTIDRFRDFSKLTSLLQTVAESTDLEKFYLVGGNVMDFLYEGHLNYQDIDLVIIVKNKREIRKYIKKLIDNGFAIDNTLVREYLLCFTEKVWVLQARKQNMLLDIAFANNLKVAIGPFDALSMYCRYPELDCIDKYGCLRALIHKEFRCLDWKNFKHENIFLIISRFLMLCVKYDTSILKQGEHQKIIKRFNERKEDWTSSTQHNKEAYWSFLSKILKCILESKDRLGFIKELVKSRILETIFDELEESLEIVLAKENKKLRKIKTKEELIILLGNILKTESRKIYFQKMSELVRNRPWDLNNKTYFRKNEADLSKI